MSEDNIIYDRLTGEYETNFIGLMKALKNKTFPLGTSVDMIDEINGVVEHYSIQLGHYGNQELISYTYTFNEENEFESFKMPVSEETLDAIYRIFPTEPLDEYEEDEYDEYIFIDCEEAAFRLKNGETVFFDADDEDFFEPIDFTDNVSADMLINGTWATKDFSLEEEDDSELFFQKLSAYLKDDGTRDSLDDILAEIETELFFESLNDFLDDEY